LKVLQQLDLSHNQLNEIPEWFGNLESLIKLNIEENKLAKLPESVLNLSNLKSISAQYGNQFDETSNSILKKLKYG